MLDTHHDRTYSLSHTVTHAVTVAHRLLGPGAHVAFPVQVPPPTLGHSRHACKNVNSANVLVNVRVTASSLHQRPPHSLASRLIRAAC
eukprot:1905352-Rhodomonas_salina.4